MSNIRGIGKDCIRSVGKECTRIPRKDCINNKGTPVPYTKEQLKGMFWRYDKNRDGRLSRKELREAFRGLGAFIPRYRANRALHYADDNGDGYISDEEVDELVEYAVQLGYTVN